MVYPPSSRQPQRAFESEHEKLIEVLGSIRETPQRGHFLTRLMALLKGDLIQRGSISPRAPLILTPTKERSSGILS